MQPPFAFTLRNSEMCPSLHGEKVPLVGDFWITCCSWQVVQGLKIRILPDFFAHETVVAFTLRIYGAGVFAPCGSDYRWLPDILRQKNLKKIEIILAFSVDKSLYK